MTREEREQKINNRIKEHYKYLENWLTENEHSCKIFGLFLQGSQNYNLDEYSDDYMSDIDTKAIVIPSTNDLIHGIEYSRTIVLPNNEHIDLKDIRTMFTMFRKQNTSYLELLFTDFKIINKKYTRWWESIYLDRERIARLDPARHALALMGSAHNKFKAMTHVSPHSEDKIEKFGYDPKELCHLIRYHSELNRYIDNKGKSYKEYLLGENKEVDEYLMRVKKGIEYTAEEAIELANKLDKEIKVITDSFVATNPKKDIQIDQLLNDVLEATVRYNIRLELK